MAIHDLDYLGLCNWSQLVAPSNSCNDAPGWAASLNSFQALPDSGRLVHASVFSTARTWVFLQAMTNVGSMQTAVHSNESRWH